MDEEEHQETVQKCQILRGPDLIKLLPPQTKIFDNVSSSSSQSELSGPFSDIVYTVEVQSKRKAKQLYGKDLYTAFSFSPEFKTAIEEIKKEMLEENPDYQKTVVVTDEKVPDAQAEEEREEVDEFIKFPGIDYEVEPEDEEVEDKKKDKDGVVKKKKKIWLDDDEEFYDTMSGYWRLLSVFDEFRISPPWYDAYAEGKEHWLQTKPVPTDVFESSRKKCLSWLDKYFDK